MIKSSLVLGKNNSSLSFRDISSTSDSSNSGSANLQNFNETIGSDGKVTFDDDSKTLANVIQNLITILDTDDNSTEIYLIDPTNDISISEGDDKNTITINLSSDFSGKQALFTMF